MRFFQRMRQFGEGLAPTNVLQELASREKVTITSDLAGVDIYGLESICVAVAKSQTLRTLSLRGDVLARMSGEFPQVTLVNSLVLLFENKELTHLTVSGQLPAELVDLFEWSARGHHRLSRLEIGDEGDLEANRKVIRSTMVEELEAAPRHMQCIVEGDLSGLRAALRTSDDVTRGALLGGHGPLTVACK